MPAPVVLLEDEAIRPDLVAPDVGALDLVLPGSGVEDRQPGRTPELDESRRVRQTEQIDRQLLSEVGFEKLLMQRRSNRTFQAVYSRR